MDYDELVDDIVKQVHARYEDYVEYQESENLDVEPFSRRLLSNFSMMS